jgi:hypothetical protein
LIFANHGLTISTNQLNLNSEQTTKESQNVQFNYQNRTTK